MVLPRSSGVEIEGLVVGREINGNAVAIVDQPELPFRDLYRGVLNYEFFLHHYSREATRGDSTANYGWWFLRSR